MIQVYFSVFANCVLENKTMCLTVTPALYLNKLSARGGGDCVKRDIPYRCVQDGKQVGRT